MTPRPDAPRVDEAFLLRLVLSFVLGGGAVALFTTVAERHGSRVGGLLLSFPVKVVISLLLIALNEGTLFAASAAVAVPSGIGVNLVFLVATALLVRRLAPWPAIAGALIVWLAAGVLVVLWPAQSALVSVLYWAVAAGAALALLSRVPDVRRARAGSREAKFGWVGLTTRALGAGTVVALSVVLAHYGGALLGGLASVFPSGWITTMVVLTRKHGADFTASTVRVMVAGSAAPVAFGFAAVIAFQRFGPIVGSLAAIGVALVTSAAVASLLHLRGD